MIILKKLREGNPAHWIMDNRMIFICIYIFKDFGLFWNIFFCKNENTSKNIFDSFLSRRVFHMVRKSRPSNYYFGSCFFGIYHTKLTFQVVWNYAIDSCCSNKIILKISTPGQYFFKKLTFIVQNMKIRIPTKSIVWILDMNQYIK